MPSRRSFVAGLLATGLVPRATWAEAGNPAYLSAGLTPEGTYVLCGLGARGRLTFALPLPARGHAAAAHPTAPEAVAFARRPGTFAIVLNCAEGRETARLKAPVGRHFYGHGAFSADGSFLFTTENDFDTGRGMIGMWDARRGYRRISEFPSGGIGPHDVRLMPDGATLVIANGGIETHPDTGRSKLNIPTMRPNLSYLSLEGQMLDQVELDRDLRQNSIRHLAVGRDESVAFAMQWQGDLAAHPPLLGRHKRGAAPVLATVPDTAQGAMVGYAGSIAISDQLGRVAITSPRGGMLQTFDLAALTFVDQIAIKDVCGVAAGKDGFFATSGLGMAIEAPTRRGAAQVTHDIKWDNHLVPI